MIFRFVAIFLSLLVLPIYGFSLFCQLSGIPDLSGNVFWFLSGSFILGIVYLWARPSFILLVFLHEFNHAIVGWLMGARIRSLEASDTVGGAVKYDFDYKWGKEIISLAPYFFQPITLLFVGVKAISQEAFDPLVCFLMGIAWAWFYFDLGTTLQVPQTDISKTGVLFAWLVIATANLLLSGIVFCAVSPQTSISGFLFDGPKTIWMILKSYGKRI